MNSETLTNPLNGAVIDCAEGDSLTFVVDVKNNEGGDAPLNLAVSGLPAGWESDAAVFDLRTFEERGLTATVIPPAEGFTEPVTLTLRPMCDGSPAAKTSAVTVTLRSVKKATESFAPTPAVPDAISEPAVTPETASATEPAGAAVGNEQEAVLGAIGVPEADLSASLAAPAAVESLPAKKPRTKQVPMTTDAPVVTERAAETVVAAAETAEERAAAEAEAGRREAENLAAAAAAAARQEAIRAESERIATERAEADRLAAEQLAAEQLAADRLAAEQETQARLEAERVAAQERKERERREQLDREKRAREERERAEQAAREAQEKVAAEARIEEERRDAQARAERQRLAREQQEREERAAKLREQQERERIEQEQAKQEAEDRAEQERLRKAEEQAKRDAERERQNAADAARQAEAARKEEAETARHAESSGVIFGEKPPEPTGKDAGGGATPGTPASVPVPKTKWRPDEPNEPDPSDNKTFTLAPGKTLVLRFQVRNVMLPNRQRRFGISLPQDLPSGWVALLDTQVDVPAGQNAELSLRLQPPISAAPGTQLFTVNIVSPDIQVAGGVTPPTLQRTFFLAVKATPAVVIAPEIDRHTRKEAATVNAGPLPTASVVPFKLNVTLAGNADTAFRLGVLPEDTDITPDGKGIERKGSGGADRAVPLPIYQSGHWRYHFDSEIENARMGVNNTPVEAEPIGLRVERVGPWWFGWQEKHTFRVGATPVTDPWNGGKTGNVATLTAVRTRLLPIPIALFIPLVLLGFLLLAGNPSGLVVTNATYEDGNTAYVVGVPDTSGNVTAKVKWEAPAFAMVRLLADNQSVGFPARSPATVSAKVDAATTKKYSTPKAVQAVGLIGGGQETTKVVYIAANPATPILVSAPGIVGAGSYSFAARGKTVISITNVASGDNAVYLYLAKSPDDYVVTGLPDSYTLDKGRTKSFSIAPRQGAAPSPGETMVILTSDAAQPKLVFTLK